MALGFSFSLSFLKGEKSLPASTESKLQRNAVVAIKYTNNQLEYVPIQDCADWINLS